MSGRWEENETECLPLLGSRHSHLNPDAHYVVSGAQEP